MIEIDLSDADIVVLHPQGPLSKQDFKSLAKTIDTRINQTDRVPNVVIQVDNLPHWESLAALTEHLRFVRGHGKIIGKVALVGDSPLLTVAPEIANQLV
ncbi:MAG: STAS/SEC14 domain-containing protein, partial [Hyphomicrobiales bacterium]